MKKAIGVLTLGILFLIVSFTSNQRVITFTETRTSSPTMYYIPALQSNDFQVIFTHSIHLSDVIENYRLSPNQQFELVSMIYEDLAIGMPGYAEENQQLLFEDGKWVLSTEGTSLPSFVLYNSSIHKKLEIRYDKKIYNVKAILPTGKSYRVEVDQLSLIERWKGEKIDGRE